MRIKQWWNKASRYVWGGVARIFGPSDDNYPETGAQPFEGKLPAKKHGSDR